MALPTWQGFGALQGSTTTLTPTMPSDIQVNDILLSFATCERTAGNTDFVTLSSANGFAATADSPQVADGAGGIKLYAFWKRAVGGDAAPVFADSGDHTAAVMCLIRGVKTSGNPWNVTSGGAEFVADTSLVIPGDTTTVANCLVVAVVADGIDGPGARWDSWANANLANLTERIDGGGSDGGGWGFGIVTGEKATAGVYGNTTATFAYSNYKAYMTLALEGAATTSASGAAVISGGGVTSASGMKGAVGSPLIHGGGGAPASATKHAIATRSF